MRQCTEAYGRQVVHEATTVWTSERQERVCPREQAKQEAVWGSFLCGDYI